MRLAAACLAALVVYPVASWLTRMAITVLTLPVSGLVRDSQSRFVLHVLRVASGITCGVAGFLVADWLMGRIGARSLAVLAALLVAFVAFAHVPGIRRLRGGPQVGGEVLSFIGEELGVVAGALVWFSR